MPPYHVVLRLADAWQVRRWPKKRGIGFARNVKSKAMQKNVIQSVQTEKGGGPLLMSNAHALILYQDSVFFSLSLQLDVCS